ncbi:hypothetical protein GC194_14505 [bacterium]|nr:hypothetical protein [bacterium]
MIKIWFILCIVISTANAFSQNITITPGIGALDYRFSYGNMLQKLGAPDSTYFFDPLSQDPVPKSLAYTEFYYDQKQLVVRYSYFMLNKLNKTTDAPTMTIYPKSTLALNGVLVAALDSALVVDKFGTPESIDQFVDEMVMSYTFREDDKFSSLSFYFAANGLLEKIRVIFGSY